MQDTSTIENTREYCSIGAMNNTVFLTYVDDVKYEAVQHRQASEAGIVDAKVQKTTKTKRYFRNDNTGELV